MLGSKAPPKIRVVGGLNELEYAPLMQSRTEMSANEVAAPELRSDMSPTTDSSTLVESSEGQSRTGGR